LSSRCACFFDHPKFVFEPKMDGFRAAARTSTSCYFGGSPYFYAFNLVMLDGKDLRRLPLLERKRRLLAIMPAIECRALYLHHISERGRDLLRVACERDLEGIVGHGHTARI
jgi:ATP-dependent DNA ligase